MKLRRTPAARARLATTQHAFTAHIRQPAAAPMPADVAPARMAVYRELLRTNVAGSLGACFPVLRKVLTPPRWDALVEDFFARHRCRTPIYRRLPYEFLEYLASAYTPAADDPPFISELAHYEWVELALTIDPTEIDAGLAADDGDLWNDVIATNPLAWLLEYRFPVHRIGPDFQPHSAEAPTFIVVYRDRCDEIGFMELNAVSARLLAHLQAQPVCGKEVIARVAREFTLGEVDTLRAFALELLATLRQRDIILGVRASKPAAS